MCKHQYQTHRTQHIHHSTQTKITLIIPLQLGQSQQARHNQLLLIGNLRILIQTAKRHARRVSIRLAAKVEAHMLERHEAGSREEAVFILNRDWALAEHFALFFWFFLFVFIFVFGIFFFLF